MTVALRVQAMVKICQEHWDESEQALEEGLALAQRMHVKRGELVRARERLAAALAIFCRLGARKDAERAEQAIVALQQPWRGVRATIPRSR